MTVVAEIALKRGDCKEASESYAKAAMVGDAALARRATEVAMTCEHLPAAWKAASRWHSLAPDDREASASYAAVALKLYRLAEARAAIVDFAKSKAPVLAVAPAPGTQGPGQKSSEGAGANSGQGRSASPGKGGAASPETGGAARPGKGGAASPGAGANAGKGGANSGGAASPAPDSDQGPRAVGLPELTALLLAQSDASSVLAAMSGALDSTNPSPDTLALLGELALDSYDSQRAQHYAELALDHDPKDFDAKRVLARAYVVRGDATKAIAAARDAMSTDARRGAFELAEVLAQLDHVEEAHQELERLRSTNAPEGEINRRLALLAFDSGDMSEAEQRFGELASSGEANDAATLFLADIAARAGHNDEALAGYRKLADSSVAVAARSRAAALLIKKDHDAALALLDDYAKAHPDSEFEMTLAKARLLADNGEAEAGLTLLTTALERHPEHPSIQYERAVILERAGRVRESADVLEKLLVQRPDDPVLTNALGYTLADHSLELPRAETLIRRALLVSPDSPAVLDSLGWVRYRQGDAKGAVPMLQRAYSIDHDSEIAAHWGEVLWASGAHQEARQVWAAALARDPSSEPLKATLNKFIPVSRETR
jgi:tetratricopeptide (TPR) repeat protein